MEGCWLFGYMLGAEMCSKRHGPTSVWKREPQSQTGRGRLRGKARDEHGATPGVARVACYVASQEGCGLERGLGKNGAASVSDNGRAKKRTCNETGSFSSDKDGQWIAEVVKLGRCGEVRQVEGR